VVDEPVPELLGGAVSERGVLHEPPGRGRDVVALVVGGCMRWAKATQSPCVTSRGSRIAATSRQRPEGAAAGSALGFRNLTNYVARSLLETGGFGTTTTPWFAMSAISRA